MFAKLYVLVEFLSQLFLQELLSLFWVWHVFVTGLPLLNLSCYVAMYNKDVGLWHWEMCSICLLRSLILSYNDCLELPFCDLFTTATRSILCICIMVQTQTAQTRIILSFGERGGLTDDRFIVLLNHGILGYQ